ncbi:Aste57867_11759 [Aphanomyces stellatus]|uniref:Aste57867_11759 protein n=1 Tax=Aphanomyces stellatus TaxID=120398 RepID=A0A485KTT6_9STRA|nr:hypothetical protein As57867_011714 [Aphanomyces stellatus]VFT88615.1 Aste57867_11759 [Aphanomyces stellatus]
MAQETAEEVYDFSEGVRLFLGETPSNGEESCKIDSIPTDGRSGPRRKIRTQLKQRLELEALRAEMTRLQGRLCQIRACPTMSFWGSRAKDEQVELLQVMHANEALRAAVATRAAFIHEMEALLQHKQRTNFVSKEWEAFVLPDAPDGRARAMHQILDREFHRTHHIFLRAGLLGTSESVHRATLTPQASSGDILFEVVERFVLMAPFRAVSAAAWRVIAGDIGTPPDDQFDQVFEPIDDNTVYIHATCRRHRTHAHVLAKYYPTPTRDVIVARSVLVDPVHPVETGDVVEDTASWTEIEPLRNDSCLMTLVWRINLGHLGPRDAREMEKASELLASASSARRSAVQGSISPHAMAQHLASNRVVTIGNLHIYLARSKLIEEPFKRAINDVIERHQEARRGGVVSS